MRVEAPRLVPAGRDQRPLLQLYTVDRRGIGVVEGLARGDIDDVEAAGTGILQADKLFKRLKAARLDNTVEAEMRRLANVQLLIIDDFRWTRPRPQTSTTGR
jgi:hypothetical protein